MSDFKTRNTERLAHLATLVAIETPLRQGQAFAAYVPWATIHEIREELDKTGYPWRDAHAIRVRKQHEAREKRIAIYK